MPDNTSPNSTSSIQDEPGWICETCIWFPPSSSDGKPCCACDADSKSPISSCYQNRAECDV